MHPWGWRLAACRPAASFAVRSRLSPSDSADCPLLVPTIDIPQLSKCCYNACALWLLANETPFAVERTWVRDRTGAEVWLVAIKATLVIDEEGTQALAPEQVAVSRIPEFRGPPESSSLISECDLIHTKPGTDVLVHGAAIAPGGRPVSQMEVQLKVSNINKVLRVSGDRIIERRVFGVGLSAPEPFTRMPIIYERAFGGTDNTDEAPIRHRWEPQNPVGVGFATRSKHVIGSQAPNIEAPDAPYRDCQQGTPAGLGPIARHWLPRLTWAGTYDAKWEETTKPLLPSDFDERFYRCAPVDQWIDGFLRGGETVELYGFTANGSLIFQLPRLSFGISTSFYDGTQTDHQAVLHTVSIWPEQRSFQMVFHSQLPCHRKVNKLQQTRVLLKRRINIPRTERMSGVWTGE